MADVFLSYSSKDRPAAERVQQALERAGITVFWDQETPPGADWDTWIRDKLTNAKAAVVLWSKDSIKSPNVRHEAIVARDAGKLVPVMVETLSPGDFPMGLYLVQGVQLQDWRNAGSGGFARLIAEVEARLGRGAGAGHVPPKNAGKIKAVRPPTPVPLLIAGIVVAAALAGGSWWAWSHGMFAKPAAPPAAATTCSDGTTVAEGSACPDPVATGLAGDVFSKRLPGRWHREGQSCAAGTVITLADGKLTFVTNGGTPFVHAIESDTDKETRTRVLSPDFVLGEQYSLQPDYVTTSDPAHDFQLSMKNLTAGTGDTWYMCEGRN